MKFTRATDPLKLPVWSPAYEPFPVPVVENADDAPYYCVRFNKNLLPFILGALEIWTYPDAFVGTQEEKNTAVALFRELQYVMGKEVCEMSVTAIRIQDCELQVQYDEETEWTTVGDLTDCAVAGPPGANGESGINGGSSPSGEPEEEKVTSVDPQDRHHQICAVAYGLAYYLVQKSEAALDLVKALLTAAQTISEITGNLIETIPIFGGIISAVLEFTTDLSTAGDLDDISAQWNQPEFRDWIQCQIYCFLRDEESINSDIICACLSSLANAAAVLPPAPPLITFYGQPFALFLLSLSCDNIFRRASLHWDERSDDCALLCADCPDNVVGITYNDGSGPSSALIGEPFQVTPAFHAPFSGYYSFDMVFNNTCTVKWVERDLVARVQDSVAIQFWNTPDVVYTAGIDNGLPFTDFDGLATLNTHKGEQHQTFRINMQDGSAATFTFEIISIP